MITFATLRTLLPTFDPKTVDMPEDRAPRGSIRRQPATAAFRVDGWYNFELETMHRSFRR